jgi:hypothetical protein
MHRLNLPTAAAAATGMFHTIQECQHKIRTAFGDSDITYGGLDAQYCTYPQGAGQVNGASPPLWGLSSSIMFEVLRDRGFASSFVTPISKEVLEF